MYTFALCALVSLIFYLLKFKLHYMYVYTYDTIYYMHIILVLVEHAYVHWQFFHICVDYNEIVWVIYDPVDRG